MLLYVLDREMNAVATMSNDIEGTMYIDDTSGGQTITLTSGCAIGSYDFKTDPYHKDSIYIKAGNFIVFTDKYGRTRMYTIMSVDGDDELDVHCEDIGLDLINEMANKWSTGTDQTLDFYLNQVIGNSSWKVVYESSGLSTQTRNLTFDNNTDTNLTRLESIMSSFGFECDFQITMQWMEVKSMEIHVYEKLYNRSENDIAQTFIDSINLVSLTRSESLEDLYTAVLPTGGSSNGKEVDISDIVYDDGQYFTTKGDNVLYDRKMAQKWNRYSGTPNANNGKYDYIYGHYSSSTTSAATLFEEALADLKEHHDVKLSYEAELLDLDADLGDYVTIVDHTKQQDIYLKARIQEVTNYYSISGSDKGTLANYTLMSTTNGDNLRDIVNKIADKVSTIATTTLYFTLDTQGSYAPIKAEWSIFKPLEIPDGYWMWIKTVKKYQNGVEEVTYTSTKDQIDYIGPETVVNRTTYYFLSTSASKALKPDGTEATTDDWTTDMPAYEEGKYFWKREKVEWSAGSITWTWALYDLQMTEAYKMAYEAEHAKVGARNYLAKSNIAQMGTTNLIAEYDLYSALQTNETYTMTIWGGLKTGKTAFQLAFNSQEASVNFITDPSLSKTSTAWTNTIVDATTEFSTFKNKKCLHINSAVEVPPSGSYHQKIENLEYGPDYVVTVDCAVNNFEGSQGIILAGTVKFVGHTKPEGTIQASGTYSIKTEPLVFNYYTEDDLNTWQTLECNIPYSYYSNYITDIAYITVMLNPIPGESGIGDIYFADARIGHEIAAPDTQIKDTISINNYKGSVTFTAPERTYDMSHVKVYAIPEDLEDTESEAATTADSTGTVDETLYSWITKAKLEIGNKSTDYTIAPEEVEQSITDTNTKIDTNISKVNTEINNINKQLDDMNSEDGIANIAHQQAMAAQKDIDDFKLYVEHGLEANFTKLNKQIVAAGEKGVMIYDAENSTNYAHITNKGMDIYVGNNMVASFQDQSTVQNLVIRHNTYFGNHLVIPFTVGGVAGTAFFWDSTAQS